MTCGTSGSTAQNDTRSVVYVAVNRAEIQYMLEVPIYVLNMTAQNDTELVV